jgi:hypothetical protein
MNKRYKLMEITGQTEKEFSVDFLAFEKKAARKGNKKNRGRNGIGKILIYI